MKRMKHPWLVSLGLVLAYHVLITVSIWAPGWVIWLVGSWLFVPIAALWMVPVCAWLHQKALDQIAFFRSALLWNLLVSLVKTVGLIFLYRGAWFDALLWSGWVMFALASVLLAFLVFTWMESVDPGARSRSTIVGEGIWQSILAALGVVLGFRLLWGGGMWLAYQGGGCWRCCFFYCLWWGRCCCLAGWLFDCTVHHSVQQRLCFIRWPELVSGSIPVRLCKMCFRTCFMACRTRCCWD